MCVFRLGLKRRWGWTKRWGRDKVLLVIPLHSGLLKTDAVSQNWVGEDGWCLTTTSSLPRSAHTYAQSDTDIYNRDTHPYPSTVTPQQQRWTSPNLTCSLICFKRDCFCFLSVLCTICACSYMWATPTLTFHCFGDWIWVWEQREEFSRSN